MFHHFWREIIVLYTLWIVLLANTLTVGAMELLVNHATGVQGMLYKHVDILVDRMLNVMPKLRFSQAAHLDASTLGKIGKLSVSRPTVSKHLKLIFNGRPIQRISLPPSPVATYARNAQKKKMLVVSDTRASSELASQDDAHVVALFITEARKVARAINKDDRFILCENVFAPLFSLVVSAARGELRQPQWNTAIRRIFEEHISCENIGQHAGAQSIGSLMQLMSAEVPSNAHPQRIQLALGRVLQDCSTGEMTSDEKTEALLRLLSGTTKTSEESVRALQKSILAELAPLVQLPLGLIGLVQEPLLNSVTSLAAESFEGGDVAGGVAFPGLTVDVSVATARSRLLAAAELARRGDQFGAKHGCLLVQDIPRSEPQGHKCNSSQDVSSHSHMDEPLAAQLPRALGEGWNHHAHEQRSSFSNKGKKRLLHAECHAIADAIYKYGEEAAFAAFRNSTVWIVELRDDFGYDDAHPCPKCLALLIACGIRTAVHTTREGTLQHLDLPPANPELLREGAVCKHLMYACDEFGVQCDRLEKVLALEPTNRDRKQSQAGHFAKGGLIRLQRGYKIPPKTAG